MAHAEMRSPIESGCPDGFQYMHPVMRKNYGLWKYHEDPRPGVLVHVSQSGDKIWTVRAGTQRILDVFTLRKLCEIGDKYGEGYVRFTIRSNIEYMVADEAKVEPLVNALEEAGFIVGGTRNSVTMISHTQGWLHCDIPGTDASGVVKSMMDELIDEFKSWEMPNRVHMTTSCCQINCGGQGDIAINVQHTKPPKINHDLVSNVCERPSVVARCRPFPRHDLIAGISSPANEIILAVPPRSIIPLRAADSSGDSPLSSILQICSFKESRVISRARVVSTRPRFVNILDLISCSSRNLIRGMRRAFLPQTNISVTVL
jgi:hypothetical protein